MSEKERLLEHLFSHKERTHENIKFFRAGSDFDALSVETFCAAVNSALLQVDTGISPALEKFPEPEVSVDLQQILSAA